MQIRAMGAGNRAAVHQIRFEGKEMELRSRHEGGADSGNRGAAVAAPVAHGWRRALAPSTEASRSGVSSVPEEDGGSIRNREGAIELSRSKEELGLFDFMLMEVLTGPVACFGSGAAQEGGGLLALSRV